MTITLYDLCGRDADLRFSPYCWRTKLALARKGLAYETRPTPFTGIAAIEDGSSKTVPVLNDNGEVVSDSFAIARYLDRVYPDAPALFGGEAEAAAARFVESWVFGTIHPILMRMIVKDIHELIDPKDQPYFRSSREARVGRTLEEHQTGAEANAADLAKALEPIRRVLAEHEWLGGREPRFIDFIPFGSLMWLRTINGSVPFAADDAVASWFERCLDLYDGLARGAPRAKAA